MNGVLALGAVVFLYALVSRRLEGTIITAPMVFVAMGVLLGPAVRQYFPKGTDPSRHVEEEFVIRGTRVSNPRPARSPSTLSSSGVHLLY